MTFQTVAKVEELSKEKPLLKKVDGVQVLVAQTEDDSVYAFENTCSHMDLPLHMGHWNAEHGHITCPAHNAVFDVKNGGKHLSPPACSPLYMVECKVEGTDVKVKLDS